MELGPIMGLYSWLLNCQYLCYGEVVNGISIAAPVSGSSRQQPKTGLRNLLFWHVLCRILLAAFTEAGVAFLDRRADSTEQHYCCKNCLLFSSRAWKRVQSQLECPPAGEWRKQAKRVWVMWQRFPLLSSALEDTLLSVTGLTVVDCWGSWEAQSICGLYQARHYHGKGPSWLLLPVALQDGLAWCMPLPSSNA